MMETAMAIIQNFGFPVFVCLWFMIRTEKVIGNNTRALIDVKEIVQGCKKHA